MNSLTILSPDFLPFKEIKKTIDVKREICPSTKIKYLRLYDCEDYRFLKLEHFMDNLFGYRDITEHFWFYSSGESIRFVG